MNINLFLAVFWLLLGLGLVIYHAIYPHEQFLRMRFLDISPGWLIMILAMWNIVRWWSTRKIERDRRYDEEMTYQRQRRRQGERSERGEEAPNPEFDFSRPLPKEERIQEQPTSPPTEAKEEGIREQPANPPIVAKNEGIREQPM
jgi:hypothetical protein